MSKDCGYKCAEKSMRQLNKQVREIVDGYELKDEFIDKINKIEKQPVRKVKITDLDKVFLEVQRK